MARKKIIAGNWKMNKTPSEAVELVNLLKDLVKNDDVDVVYCVPAIDIVPVVEATKGTNVAVGAENMYFEESGAYTGEISAAMLVDAGVKYVIIGVCLLYLCLKWMLYSFLGWIFFDESVTTLWLESYSTLLYYLGFALFPFALFVVYFDLSLQLTIIIGLILAFFAKILMLYKWLKLFCNNLYGGLLLIVYFCALEIMPCFVLYQGVTQLNDYLIIKF